MAGGRAHSLLTTLLPFGTTVSGWTFGPNGRTVGRKVVVQATRGAAQFVTYPPLVPIGDGGV